MNKFDLQEGEVERIFKEMILPQVVGNVRAEKQKQAFVLGGQPGSGKSVAAREILKSNPDTVFINADDLRSYHPRYYLYLKENDKEAADLTQEVVRYWAKLLREECEKSNLSMIIEGTMRTIASPLETAKSLKDNNYFTNLAVVSTPYELSLLSIQNRYNESKRIGAPARFTKQTSHDETYKKIEENLTEILNANLFDRLFVYQRVENGFKENVFEPSQKELMLKVFTEGRKRKVEDREKDLLNEEFKNKYEEMRKRLPPFK